MGFAGSTGKESKEEEKVRSQLEKKYSVYLITSIRIEYSFQLKPPMLCFAMFQNGLVSDCDTHAYVPKQELQEYVFPSSDWEQGSI